MIRPATLHRLAYPRVSSNSLARCRAIPKRALSSTSPTYLNEHLPKSTSPIVSNPHFFNSVTPDGSGIPTYRVLDGSGKVLEGAEVPEVSEEMAAKMYENMLLLPTLDNVLYNVQRQGKISFYVSMSLVPLGC